MRKATLFLLIVLNAHAFSKPDTFERFRLRALREGWTFKFSEHKKHGKGLKKKYILQSERKSFLESNVEIPNTLDLRDSLSPIQDQGACGSCWAHSLTATLEDGYSSLGKKTVSLSPQYLVDCASNADGCDGGYFDAALYLILPKGSPARSAYPYIAEYGRCKNSPPVASISTYHLLGSSNGPSTKDIEAYMAKYKRPISITVAAGAGPWQSYDSGVYNGCTFEKTDHMINIVGWDNEGYKFDKKGNLPHGKGVWILRNSWGTSWGEKGWMRTKMTDSKGNKCNNVAEEAAYFDFNKKSDEDEEEPTNPKLFFYSGLSLLGAGLALGLLLALRKL